MKRARNIVCIAGLLAVMMTSTAFAEGDLEITGSYPEDGQKNTTIENVAAKIQFSKDVGNKKNQEANSKCFSMVDEDGEELPIRVYYNPEDPKEVLVLADTTEMNAEKITVKDIVGRPDFKFPCLNEVLHLIERSPHLYPHLLALVAPCHDASVIVGKHHDRPALQLRLEDPLTGDEKIVAVYKGIHDKFILS